MPMNRSSFPRQSKPGGSKIGIKTNQFGQFDMGPGQRYASSLPSGGDRKKAMSGLGSASPPIEQRRAAVDKATADLMEISTPYIGGNRVVPKT